MKLIKMDIRSMTDRPGRQYEISNEMLFYDIGHINRN